MVKPPRTMQPEAVNVGKAGRKSGAAFTENSFHNYMARKIDMQRKQFGLVLPPDPSVSLPAPAPTEQQEKQPDQHEQQEELSRIDACVDEKAIREERTTSSSSSSSSTSSRKRKSKKFGISTVVKRLKRKHGKSPRSGKTKRRESCSQRSTSSDEESSSSSSTTSTQQQRPVQESQQHGLETSKTYDQQQILQEAKTPPSNASVETAVASASSPSPSKLPLCRQDIIKLRPDLFLTGVVVLVNGYTNPDVETLQRLLHKHGGDLEKYETSRVTHIVAEHLSTAKANIYKRQRNPIPVCKPSWLVDSVQAKKLLPATDYLIDEVKDGPNSGIQSVASFFQQANNNAAGAESSSSSATTNRTVALDRTAGQQVLHSSDRSPPSKDHESVPVLVSDRVAVTENDSPPTVTAAASESKMDHYINGKIRTVGNDPNFLDSFFASSRLSFIGSYKQRARQSPVKSKTASGTGSTAMDRFVFHVDMDCFFASVALRKFPQYRNKPVVISHHGESSTHHGDSSTGTASREVPKDSSSECATCNYEARKFGIKKGMYLGRAKALCPELIILKYDFEGYEEVSEAVSDILDRHASAHGGYVEPVSCDEAYVEFKLARRGEDSSKTSREIAAELAESIRREIFETTQCTATVGVARNKLLAKLATDHVKPNKSFVVKDDGKDLLKSLQLRDLHGIGYRSERKLEEEDLLSVQDVWDLGGRGEAELVRILGQGLGKKIFRFCQGKDDRPVEPAERKTIGAECNYGVRFDGPYGVDYMIEGLCKEVEKRMVHVGTKGTKVTLKVKQRKQGAPPPPKFLGHGSCHNLSKSGDTNNLLATRNWKDLFDVARQLFADMNVPKEDVRGMGLVVSKLVSDDAVVGNGQASSKQSITNWFSGQSPTRSKTNCASESTSDRDDTRVGFSSPLALPIEESPQKRPPALDIPGEKKSATGSGVTIDDDTDISLPALSQIHMSQVDVLPSPLRKHVVSKMEREKTEAVQVQEPVRSNIVRESRFRQTDVKRLFCLAAVKNGEEVSGLPNANLSLSQLESLPLEMQLQVANNDQRRVGTFSPNEKKSKRATRPPAVSRSKTSKEKQPTRPTRRHTSKKDVGELSEVGITTPATPHTITFPANDAFYKDDIVPLCDFMNDNPNVEEGSEQVEKVAEFLCCCIDENRISDAVLLLRSIKNRGDRWSGEAFNSIYATLDAKVEESLGSRLDKEWVLQL